MWLPAAPGKRGAGTRWVFGFTVDELGALDTAAPNPSLLIRLDRLHQHEFRKPVGAIWREAPEYADPRGFPIRYHVDKHCFASQYYGVIHRYGRAPRPVNDIAIAEFARYFRCLVRRCCPRLDLRADISLEHHLEHNGKSAAYNLGLRQSVAATSRLKPGDFRCSSFIKDEAYDKPKHQRHINAFDAHKSQLANFAHAVDECVYQLPYFVKHANNADRARKLRDLFGDDSVVGSDFSAMECHHYGILARLALFWMGHVLGNHGEFRDYRYLLAHLLCGTNVCSTNTLSVSLDQTLMSGAPWTSSQNGFLNLCIMSYLDLKTKHPTERFRKLVDRFEAGECRLVVEGDDALVASTGFDPQLIDDLGIFLKIEEPCHYTEASFCGLVYADKHDDQVMTDPRKALTDFFVIPMAECGRKKTVIDGLQRAKAMSGAFMHRRTPILSVLYAAVLQKTRSVQERFDLLDSWKQTHYQPDKEFKQHCRRPLREIAAGVHEHTRLYMEQKYGFEVSAQIEFEEAFIQWADGASVELPYHPRLEPFFENACTHQLDCEKPTRVYWDSPLPDPVLFYMTNGQLDPKKRVYRPADGTYHKKLTQQKVYPFPPNLRAVVDY